MTRKEVRVPRQSLHEFAIDVFVKAGCPIEDARVEADALVWANLRGVDSHGVLRIPWYVENLGNGIMNPRPNIHTLKETPATLFIEADRALGPVVTVRAVELTVKKAKEIGICWTLIRNLTHQGALGYYSQMMAEKGVAGLLLVCNPPNMAPHGAKAAGVHNSPIAISVPAKRHRAINLDMATSVVAGGKLWLASDRGTPIPLGWALDKDGAPTTDPKKFATLLPMGGPKGSGLAMVFECLSSLMAGNPLLEPSLFGKEKPEDGKTDLQWERPGLVPRHNQNSVVAAINISHFTDLENYKDHVDNLIDGIKALPREEGFDEIFVPGEPEERTCLERSRDGIPLPEGTIRNLKLVAEKFGLKLPAGL
jgi:ureidoglycolate dehydrogenase (NAD+)